MLKYLTSAFIRQPSIIKQIRGRKIFDSKGNPTIEADVITGLEVLELLFPLQHLQENTKHLSLEMEIKYMGKGVSKDMKKVSTIISPSF